MFNRPSRYHSLLGLVADLLHRAYRLAQIHAQISGQFSPTPRLSRASFKQGHYFLKTFAALLRQGIGDGNFSQPQLALPLLAVDHLYTDAKLAGQFPFGHARPIWHSATPVYILNGKRDGNVLGKCRAQKSQPESKPKEKTDVKLDQFLTPL